MADTPDVREEGASAEDADSKILAEAHARLKLAEEAESEIRRLALEDLEFRAGNQWPESIKAERARDNRPCLTINRIPQFIQQITNDQRQNRPSIKVHPVDDHADLETAKVYQGLIRHIEYNSNADVAYDTAFDSAATGGFGYWRVITDYVDPLSFEQEILIKRIRNPFSVFFDPFSQEPDGSDASFAFVVEEHSKAEYSARYPESKLASQDNWDSIGNSSPGWAGSDMCRVVEYFYKSTTEKEIVLLSSGETVFAEQIPEEGLPKGIAEVQRRKTTVPVIRWAKMNAMEILAETEWPGRYIPIVPVYGNELYINGKRILEGVIRNAKDPQRMLNFWKSAETETIALAPKAPWVIAEGQVAGYEAMWRSANRANHAYLPYKPFALNGTPLPPPQRQAFEPAVQAITQAAMLAAEDLKSTTGIYDAALGSRSNETSGVAIQRRNQQAQTSNFHFIDNLTRSLRHTGRILIDLIPKIYDTARTARIIGEDGEQRIVKLNEQFEENGKQVKYDLGAGKFDVTVDVGPSFASKRQEAASSMMEVTRAVPQLMQVAGDLMIKNMDWPGAQEIADRLKKTLPPGLADDPKAKGQDIPPQIKAQMEQMSAMLEQTTAKLNELQSEREQKLIEIESRERIEMRKLEVNLEIERAKLDAKDSLAILNAEIAQLEARQRLLRVDQPIATDDERFAPQDLGAMSADEAPVEQYPTGGASPGLPMEGISSDDPNAY